MTTPGTAYPVSSRGILAASHSWDDIRKQLENADKKTKGDVFELLVQNYLQLDDTWKSTFKNVWSTSGKVPDEVRESLNLPPSDTVGIDFVAETLDGKYWAIQCKYHHAPDTQLTGDEVVGVLAGKSLTKNGFEQALVCSTADGRSENLKNYSKSSISYLMGNIWRNLSPQFFNSLHAKLKDEAPSPLEKRTEWPHQSTALTAIDSYFQTHSRGKVIMPCATGKSLIGFWAAQRMKAHTVLVTVPSLSLVQQLLKDWMEQSAAHALKARFIIVCSDESVAASEREDEFSACDLGVKVDTDVEVVTTWLQACSPDTLSIVFTTYQSGKVTAEAAKKANLTFDLGIFDEAHRMAGQDGRLFGHLLSDTHISIVKRMFMTATPRIVTGKKVGSDIYVPTSLYIDHGEDDIQGGLGEVAAVKVQRNDPLGRITWVKVRELPGRWYNWENLQREQAELKKEHKSNRDHPDPDPS